MIRPVRYFDNITIFSLLIFAILCFPICYHDNCHRDCKRVYVRFNSKRNILLVPLDLPISSSHKEAVKNTAPTYVHSIMVPFCGFAVIAILSNITIIW